MNVGQTEMAPKGRIEKTRSQRQEILTQRKRDQGFFSAAYKLLPNILGFVSLFLIWHLASVYVVQSILFPSPLVVFQKAWSLALSGVLFESVGYSLRRILIGFFMGSAIAVPLGLIIGSFSLARKLLEPWTEFLRFIPSVAMITIAVIWFGIGEQSKIFLIIYSTIFIVILNTAAGVSAITPNTIRAALVLGASQRQVFFNVSLPATVPYILTGMRLAMANSFTTIVAAEMIAANEGIGVMLWNGRMYMLIDEIFVALFRWAIFRFAGRYSPVA